MAGGEGRLGMSVVPPTASGAWERDGSAGGFCGLGTTGKVALETGGIPGRMASVRVQVMLSC